MRRTLSVLLVSALLSVSAPSFARRDDGERFNPIRFIKKIVRILLPLDDIQPTPPKP
jgi:hypothetical protein